MSETIQAYISIDNQSSEEFAAHGDALNWGKVLEGPDSVKAFQNIPVFTASGREDSWSGTSGSVSWKGVTTGSVLTVNFDSPWDGDNSVSLSPDGTFNNHYKATHSKIQTSGSLSVAVTIAPK